MVEGKLSELGHDPADVQLVIKELSSGQHKPKLHDESKAFAEAEKPEKHSILTTDSYCPSLVSSRESTADELADMVVPAGTGSQESLESVNNEFMQSNNVRRNRD